MEAEMSAEGSDRYCAVLNRFFVKSGDIEAFCKKQKPGIPDCQNCVRAAGPKMLSPEPAEATPARRRRIPPRKSCKKCGLPFRTSSNRQIFCERCKIPAKNDRNRTWMKAFRKLKKEVTGGRLEA